MESDFLGVLDKVADIGYQGVEFAGFGDIKASILKKHLDSLGLKAAGSHTGLDLLRDDLQGVIEYNLEIENKYVIVPHASYDSKEDYLNMAIELNEIGAKLKDKGLQLCYHNHAHELEKYDGECGLDLLYSNTDPELLKTEIDTFWVKKAGIDPVSYLAKYSGRSPLIHLKDMEAETGDFAEVGEGIIDTQGLIKQADKNNSEWLVVEQDKCKKPALQSVKISYNNLKEMLS